MSNLLISVGDYVLIQEGQSDQPKIIVWDEMAITEFLAVSGPPLPIAVFDAIVTEDPAVPQLIFNVALAVFDNVRIQEGQADSDTLLIAAIDTITLTESVDLHTTRLNIAVNDGVTVLDVPAIFAQGPLGSIAIETITVQESPLVRMTVYILASDNILVVDGALAPEVNEAITIAEDVTVKLARLVLNFADSITVTESLDITGSSINAVVFDESVLNESVTVLLTSLSPMSADSLTVTEAVTVAVSSIGLTINVQDSVSLVEVITNQTNPMQIDEFTQILLTESISAVFDILKINLSDNVTVVEAVDARLLPILLDVADSVTVSERIALRIGGGRRKRADLLTVGAGE